MMENNNNNEELLKVENLDKNEYVVASSIVDVPKPQEEGVKRKVNIFSVIMSALSHKMAKDKFYAPIRPVATLKLSIMALILSAILYIFYNFADMKIMLPVIIALAVLTVPTLFISLMYEICPEKKLSVFQVFLAFILGVLLYMFINMLVNLLRVRSIYATTIEVLVTPVLWVLGELLIVMLLSKIYNITDVLTGILIAVSIGMGYVFSQLTMEYVSSLFVSVDVIIDVNNGQHYNGAVIIDDFGTIKKALGAMFKHIGWHGFYYPVMMGCWSVVIGNVISVTNPIGKRKDRPFSVYLLVVLVVVFFMLSVFSTSFVTFDIIIKILSTLFTLYISIRLINNALTKSLESKHSEKQ